MKAAPHVPAVLARCFVLDEDGIESMLATVERDERGRFAVHRVTGGADRCKSLADGIAKAEALAAVCPSYRTLSRIERI